MIVCVAGNPAIDKLFETDSLRAGEIHRPEAFIPLPGGKGIHVAQVATALGAEAIATGILGGHHGRWLAETLAGEGVPGVFAWAQDGETRSCLTVADRATGGLTEFYEDGILASGEDWAALTHVVQELLAQRPSWLAMAGSVPAAPDAGETVGYAPLVTAARAAGVRSAVDSRGADLAGAVKAGPDLTKVNADEACELLGLAGIHDVDQAHEAAREIRARAGGDGHAAVVTLGEQGMVLIEPTGAAWHGAVAGPGDYPVGSGDAFLAGLITALSDDTAAGSGAWPQAARLALGAATANAQIPGAARLDPARARELAAAAEIVPLAG